MPSAGPARRAELEAFAQARLRAVRLRSHVHSAWDVPRWRDVGADFFVLQLLTPLLGQRPVAPRAFVDLFSDEVERFMRAGVTYIEVHEHPTRPERGAGVVWRDGAEFAQWFYAVAYRLRSRFGPEIKVGFPALDEATPSEPLSEPAISWRTRFLEQVSGVLEAADWVALHVYWRTWEEMRALDGALRFLEAYLASSPLQAFVITEFANLDRRLSAEERGAQYAEFVLQVSQYERVRAVIGFPMGSADPQTQSLAWLREEDGRFPVIEAFARRPGLPPVGEVVLRWPTRVQRCLRSFGDEPFRTYTQWGVNGGHNGVDLALASSGEEGLAVTACLAGTVVQVARDSEGYHKHVRVRSYTPSGQEITLLYAHLKRIEVSIGALVSPGELLGWGGARELRGVPYLHLGMRVAGVHLPATRDWINPRPYLAR